MTVRFLLLGGELRRAQQKLLRFFQFFKSIEPDLGLKSALAAVNGAVTDATVEVTDDAGLHSAAADLAMGATLVLVSLGQGEPRKGKTLWNSDLPARLSLARLGTRHHHPPLSKKKIKKVVKKSCQG